MANTNYTAWKQKFDGQIVIVVKADTKIIQEACHELYSRIVERTPVGNPALWNPPVWPRDYTPGALKANWTIEQEGDDYVISNDLPYAQRVETGYSTQAPAGMMRISIKEFGAILNEVAKRYKK